MLVLLVDEEVLALVVLIFLLSKVQLVLFIAVFYEGLQGCLDLGKSLEKLNKSLLVILALHCVNR